MALEKKLQSEIEILNQGCIKCQQDFAKAGIPFPIQMCNICASGNKIHNLGMKVSTAERKWGNINWTSSRWKDLYQG